MRNASSWLSKLHPRLSVPRTLSVLHRANFRSGHTQATTWVGTGRNQGRGYTRHDAKQAIIYDPDPGLVPRAHLYLIPARLLRPAGLYSPHDPYEKVHIVRVKMSSARVAGPTVITATSVVVETPKGTILTTTVFTTSTPTDQVAAAPSSTSKTVDTVPVGAIAGGAVAGVFLAVAAVIAWHLWGRSIKRKEAEKRKQAVRRAVLRHGVTATISVLTFWAHSFRSSKCARILGAMHRPSRRRTVRTSRRPRGATAKSARSSLCPSTHGQRPNRRPPLMRLRKRRQVRTFPHNIKV